MDISKEYNDLRDNYEDFLLGLKRVIRKILSENDIPIAFDVSGRLKKLNSIIEKNESGRFKLKQSITELHDIVGLRIVLLFPEYKTKVQDILLQEFKLAVPVKSSKAKIDTFGYSSLHLILGIKNEWQASYDWRKHLSKKFEIQIRTLSEHIWAETSHTLFYKREENIPDLIRRDLYRLSALLEVVDEKLENIKKRVKTHFDEIKTGEYEKILELDLNPETFRRVMMENSKGKYDLDNYQNMALSARIEKNYNILNSKFLDDLIKKNLEFKPEMNSKTFVPQVLKILDKYKGEIDKQQEKK